MTPFPPPEAKLQWFARGGLIRQQGPYRTQLEAVESIRLVDDSFPPNAFVWPELKPAPKRTKRKKHD